MSATQRIRKQPRSNKGSFGLLANGCSGPWDVELDEATGRPGGLYLQIEGPSVSFSLEIPRAHVLRRIAELLETRQAGKRQVSNGATSRNSLLIINRTAQTPT